MKVILSRKGFDSSSGGFASPVFDKKEMLSLPIPEVYDRGGIGYDRLRLPLSIADKTGCETYKDLMSIKIKTQRTAKSYFEHMKAQYKHKLTYLCHPDPDLLNYWGNEFGSTEKEEWLPMFGQSDSAQTILSNEGVGEGDLFLFFGRFRHVDTVGGLKFEGEDFHAIWGYMQVDKVISGDGVKCKHTHTDKYYTNKKANAIYIAKKNIDLPVCKGMAGANVLPFDEKRVLTDVDCNGNRRSVTKWKVQEFMKDENLKISCHENTSFYGIRRDERDKEYFQSVSRGQEFVFGATEEVSEWVKEVFSVF